jgi:hypothetical protein
MAHFPYLRAHILRYGPYFRELNKEKGRGMLVDGKMGK